MNRKNIFLILSIFIPPLVLIILRMYFASYLSIFYVNLTVSSIIILIVVSPILEELVFRLFLQDVFLSKINNKLIALFLVNLLFVLVHYKKPINIVYLLALFICGMILSIIKQNYKLSYAIYLHSYYNILFIIVL